MNKDNRLFVTMSTGLIAFSGILSSGCVVVGGYSSERGWFIWPGTFVILLVGALLMFAFRRRK